MLKFLPLIQKKEEIKKLILRNLETDRYKPTYSEGGEREISVSDIHHTACFVTSSERERFIRNEIRRFATSAVGNDFIGFFANIIK